jgi:HPt (histidine-containing phosphotransfer) domain-containing protein
MREEDRPARAKPGWPRRVASADTLDRSAVLGGACGNIHLLQELVKLFLAECPQMLGTLRDSIRRGDAAALRSAAQSLHEATSQFGPSYAAQVAHRLETMGASGDLTGAADTYYSLDKAVHQLQSSLAALALEPAS